MYASANIEIPPAY